MAFSSHVAGRAAERLNTHAEAPRRAGGPGILLPPPLFRAVPLNLPTPGNWSPLRRPHDPARPPHLPAAQAAGPPQTTRHPLPGPGRLLRHLHAPLRPTGLPLPPRRPPAYRPAPHLQGGGQDPLRVRPPRLAPRGPHMARRTQAPQETPARDPSTDGGAAARPGEAVEAARGATLSAGRALVQTTRHF